MIAFDDILKNVVGEYGSYQKRRCFLLALVNMVVAMRNISPVFIQAESDHWCKVPESVSLLETCQSLNISEDCIHAIKHLAIPKERSTGGCQSGWKFSNCRRYENISVDFDANSTNFSSATINCDQGWEYDTSQYKATAVQEFGLVCDKKYQSALATSFHLAGIGLGNVIYGPLSDRIGRLTTLMISSAHLVICGVIESLSPNFVVFVIVRFVASCGHHGIYLSSFILMTEMVGPSKRAFAGGIFFVTYSCGYVVFVLYAYLVRNWRHLVLVITLPAMLFFLYWWLVTESARWLLARGNTTKAVKIIREMARVNGNTVPQDMFASLNDGVHSDVIIENTEKKIVNTDKARFSDLFRYPNIRKKMFLSSYLLFSVSITYYGFVYNATSLAGNDYINVALAGAVEIPANIIIVLLVETKLGRKYSFLGGSALTAAASIGAIFVPSCSNFLWIKTALNVVGKSTITSLCTLSFLYASELYPTEVRSLGVSVGSTFALFGGTLAPQILLAGTLWDPLPMVVFAAVITVAGLAVLLLPETRGKRLEQTIEEGEAATGGKYKKAAQKVSTLV